VQKALVQFPQSMTAVMVVHRTFQSCINLHTMDV
jgi:hypothetical protein